MSRWRVWPAVAMAACAGCGSGAGGTSDVAPDASLDVAAVDTAATPDTRHDLPGTNDAVADSPDPGPPPCAAYEGRGPFVAGVRTFQMTDRKVEVWYPADPGVEAGLARARYDVREWLPEAEKSKVPAVAPTYFEMNAYRDVPASKAGPFPLVVFSHGMASFRCQSSDLTSHLASWGFVVAAPDHVERGLAAVMLDEFSMFGQDVPDIRNTIDLVKAESARAGGPLRGLVDASRIAVAGHSAGGATTIKAGADPEVKAMVTYAAGGPGMFKDVPAKPIMLMGGTDDGFVPIGGVEQTYDSLPPVKGFLSLAAGGHLAFTDICAIARDQGGVLRITADYGVEVPEILILLGSDGCAPENLPAEQGWAVINHFTTAHLRYALGMDETPIGLDVAAAKCFGDRVTRLGYEAGARGSR